ncbi:MAG: M20/M25/M40 family metallo-hydrolase [Angelakisella sp.]
MDSLAITAMTERLTGVVGVAGRESAAAKVAAEYLAPLGEVTVTSLGSVLCTVCRGEPGAPHLLLEAHLDQIGLVVTYLEENGFLRIHTVGGYDRRLLPAAPVTVHADSGDYAGVISSVPPHLAGKDDKPLKIEDFLVDTGFSTEKAKELFAPGNMITLNQRFAQLANGRIATGALDDRIGCVAVIAAAEQLHREGCRCKVTVLLASQEEVGGIGSGTAAYQVKPDMAIAVDVSFAEGFGAPEHRCGKLGEGVMIGIAPVLDNSMTDQLLAFAKKYKLPYQPEAMGGHTGTDADDLVVTANGIRTALLSIPQRNMHTTVETVDMADVMGTAELMVHFAKEVQ